MTDQEVDLYARLSKDDQGTELGVDRQVREVTEQIIEPHGWRVRHVRIDNDLSATDPKVTRPAFEALLSTRPVVPIVCWHIDRLVRVSRDLERVIELDVNVHTLHAGHIDLSTPAGRAVARTVTAWSTYEGEIRNARQRAQQRQRAEAGRRWWSTRPFGFELDGTVRADEAAVLAQAYANVLSGVTLAGVARAWNEAGVPRPKGEGRWTSQHVGNMLRAPRNAAILTHNSVEAGRGDWQPVVDVDTYRATMRVLSDPGRRTGGGAISSLATGLLVCGVCGGPARGATWKGRGRTSEAIYQCATARCVRANKAWLDLVLGEYVVNWLARPASAAVFEEDVTDVSELREEVTRLRERLEALGEDYAEGLITREAMRSGSVRLSERLERAEGALAQVHASQPLSALRGATDVRSQWEEMPLDHRRATLKALVDRIVLNRRPSGYRSHQVEDVEVHWRGTHESPHPD